MMIWFKDWSESNRRDLWNEYREMMLSSVHWLPKRNATYQLEPRRVNYICMHLTDQSLTSLFFCRWAYDRKPAHSCPLVNVRDALFETDACCSWRASESCMSEILIWCPRCFRWCRSFPLDALFFLFPDTWILKSEASTSNSVAYAGGDCDDTFLVTGCTQDSCGYNIWADMIGSRTLLIDLYS